MKRFIKTRIFKVLIAIIVTLAFLCAIAIYINPYRSTTSWNSMENTLPINEKLTVEEAHAELKYLITLIKDRHFSAVNSLPEKVLSQYNEETQNMPEHPTVLDVWQSGSRILKQLDDAHSAMYYYCDDKKLLNIDFKLSGGELICSSSSRKGQRLVKINDIEVKDLYKRFLSQFSYENIYYAEHNFPKYLRRSSGLNWLGVECYDKVQLTFSNNGAFESEYYSFEELKSDNIKPDFVRYIVDRDKSIGILTLDSCRYNDKYKNTLRDFFADVKSNAIKYIAVDLRKNGGGNSAVANEFIKYLPVDSYMDFGGKVRLKYWAVGEEVSSTKNNKYEDLLFNGDVYVITSKSTFSSATWFAVLLRDNNLCKVIGEPSGNRPSAYGDVLTFQLPYSKLSFSLTYKQFSRPAVEKHNEPALIPDYLIDQEKAIEELYRILSQYK
ncbi:MAG: S41 family peptidase [Bacillota bacterium]